METWKKSRFAKPKIFLGFEIYFDFSRPWFSEIRVQIIRPRVSLHLRLRGKQQFKFYIQIAPQGHVKKTVL